MQYKFIFAPLARPGDKSAGSAPGNVFIFNHKYHIIPFQINLFQPSEGSK